MSDLLRSNSVVCLWALVCLVLMGCGRLGPESVEEQGFHVFVSILPQAQFAERVGGEHVNVHVMVQPGANPATYEPTVRQMEKLGRSKLYFRIGVPFERAWMGKIVESHPHLKIVDTAEGIRLRRMQAHVHEPHEGDHADEHREGKDPHIWLDPNLVQKQARRIYRALSESDPAHSEDYRRNFEAFQGELEELDAHIRRRLSGLEDRRFMVYHPVFGYFADRYGLQQIPVELEGKEPGARRLTRLIERARKENIRVIFVQKQFSTESAEVISRAIDGEVVTVDPLGRDYVENMRHIADVFAETLK